MSFPNKCVVDTNVPKTANLAHTADQIPEELLGCVEACVLAIEQVTSRRGLVMDADDEIFDEYRQQLSMRGQPGIGDRFMKWVNDHRWSLCETDRVKITADGDSYREFPQHPGLAQFDRSDQKFVAVANAHPEKPAILQATDSKWWGWKEALSEVGLTVRFLCPEYVQSTHQKKFGS